MKFAVIIVLCCLVVASLADLPEEVKEKIEAANKKCQENPATAIDEAARLVWVKSGRNPSKRPPNFGPHTLCIAKALDWIKEDGSPNREGLKEIQKISNSDKVEEIIYKCIVKQETPEDTALLIFKCLMSQ